MKKLLFVLVFLPIITLAQGGELVVGEKTISYASSTEKDGITLYYENDALAASQHDGVWLVYNNDEVVYEAHDTNSDGESDTFIALNGEGEVVEITGLAAENLERPAAVEFRDLMGSGADGESLSDEDLVGDLSSITIPSYHNYLLYFIILATIGGGIWWYRKKNS